MPHAKKPPVSGGFFTCCYNPEFDGCPLISQLGAVNSQRLFALPDLHRYGEFVARKYSINRLHFSCKVSG